MADFNVLLPAGPLSTEGGGAYLSNLVAALRSAGHGVWFGDGPPSAIQVAEGMAIRTLAAEQLRGAIGLIHHPTALAEAEQHDAIRSTERERLPLLRAVVVTSEPIRERLITEYGFDPAAAIVVRPGVSDAARSPGSASPHCTLLSIGALVPRKGHAVLLQALARLFDLPWRLVIVGDTARDAAYAAAVQAQMVESNCTGRVRLAGRLDAEALEAEWQRADIFALATAWEGYSAPVAEALRRGLPVAVTSGGNAAELVTPESGIVCAPDDVVTLSKALRRLIFDTALRADMAEAAWQIGRTLPDWSTQAARFVEATQCC